MEEPISTFVATAAGYIFKAAASSKVVKTAKEELLGRFWQWLRPHFIRDVPEAETAPDGTETHEKVEERLLTLIEDEAFYNELVKRVSALQQAGVKEKNIVSGAVKRVKKIRIGDKTYSPDEHFDRKNIVEGSVEDADKFTLGDGH